MTWESRRSIAGSPWKPVAVVVAVLVIALLALGCGDEDGDSDAASSTSETTETGGGAAASEETTQLFVASAENGTLSPAAGGSGGEAGAAEGEAGGTGTERDGGGQAFTLTLEDADANVVVFTDRPERKAGTEPLAEFVDGWERRGFNDDPPNAALEVSQDSGEPVSSVFELSNPRYDEAASSLSFEAAELGTEPSTSLAGFAAEDDQELPASFAEASLFIDNASATADGGDIPNGQMWTYEGGNGEAVVTIEGQTLAGVEQPDSEAGDLQGGLSGANGFELTCFSNNCVGSIIFGVEPQMDQITGTVQYDGKAKLTYKDASGSEQTIPDGKFSVPSSK